MGHWGPQTTATPTYPPGMMNPGGILPSNRPQAQSIQPPPVLEKQIQSPGGYPLYFYRFANGHRVIVEQRPQTDIINLRTYVDAGSINEDPMFESGLYQKTGFAPGIAHVDEHCHFPEAWTETVKSYGTRINASTDHEYIEHYITFNREDTARMLDLHAEALLHPTYVPADIKREQSAVVNEINEKMKEPGTMMFSKGYELMFERPFKQVGGGRDDVLGVQRDDLLRFVDKYYTPDNLVTVISGHVDPQQVAAQLNQTFGAVPPRPSGPKATLKMALGPQEIRTATVYHPQLQNSQMAMLFPAPPAANLKDRMAMVMLMMYLAGSELAPLNKELTLDADLALGIGAGYRPLKETGVATIDLSTYPGQEQPALQKALSILYRTTAQPIPQNDLDRIRFQLMNNFRQSLNDVEGATLQLGSETLTNSLDYYLHFLDLVQSVSTQDIQRMARQYLNPNRYALVYALPGDKRTESDVQVIQRGYPQQQPTQPYGAWTGGQTAVNPYQANPYQTAPMGVANPGPGTFRGREVMG